MLQHQLDVAMVTTGMLVLMVTMYGVELIPEEGCGTVFIGSVSTLSWDLPLVQDERGYLDQLCTEQAPRAG